jgi:hypothetical protein
MQDQFDVFISYSAKDMPLVRPLAERLRQDGLRVWFDEWEIKPGDSIPVKIEAGLTQSARLLLCMSANAFGSDWTTLESQTVRFPDPLNKGRKWIPLRLDDTTIPGSLAQFKYIDWRTPNADAYAELLSACGKTGSAGTHDWPAPPPDDTAERILQTRQLLLALLHKNHFPPLPGLTFDSDGMPQELSRIFHANPPITSRATVAEKCIVAIPKLAKAVVEAVLKPLAGTHASAQLGGSEKISLRLRLITAMQEAILLSVRSDILQAARSGMFDCPKASPLDVEYALGVSMLTRGEKLPELVQAMVAPGTLPRFHDTRQANLFGEVEMGISEQAPRPGQPIANMAHANRQGAETEVAHILWKTALPNQGEYSPDRLKDLQGVLWELKQNDETMLAILSAEQAALSTDFMQWLHQKMHLGLFIITKQNGVFEVEESRWRASLARLYQTLQPFAPES